MNTSLGRLSTAGSPRFACLLTAVRVGMDAEPGGAHCLCPEGGLAVPPEAELQVLEGSSCSVAFLPWIHFLDAKHLYLLVLSFEQCLWLVCFKLHYRLECNCGESIFILLRVASNHSYMLQRIYNCLVLYMCVFNCIQEVLWRGICIIWNL